MKSRAPKIPWVLRLCPDRWQKAAIFIGVCVGAVGLFVFGIGGMMAVLLAPAYFVRHYPEAPISQPVVWLLRALPKDAAITLLGLLQFGIVFLLLSGINVFVYAWRKSLRQEGLNKAD
jgi:hypothetical protein